MMLSFGNFTKVGAQGSLAIGNNKLTFQEHVIFKGWKNCVKLSNGSVELIVTTDVGPRIIRFGFVDGPNIFYVSPTDKGKTGGTDWHLYGGHRFWHSPEVAPRTYSPDNSPVNYTWDGTTLKLIQDVEPLTSIVKEIEITLKADKDEVKVMHRMINKSCWNVELAPWSISACAAGGRAIVPQEPYIDPADYLLPIRPIVLWAYTKMTDPRYTWGDKYIQAKQDSLIKSETKIGVLNKQKWVAFYLNKTLFVKTFGYDPNALYPDYGCNNEIYINGDFLEVESLGPLSKILPQGIIEHTEYWSLHKVLLQEEDDSIEKNVLPLVKWNK
ncbi:hypothetical protein AQPE_2774 [Aquipluma nitroreducens]|uniref:DUF4380 domain-containing protein n=2 Tax=Aquipluma nitroreducens TaxID=2010828 RepID=A0A5K7SAK3_9BACT|nr:hypothetical protein AQPE_2774 [Aquipluma nitroreducens]